MTGFHVFVGEDKKCFVNRVLLHITDFLSQDVHHTVRQVAVQDVACRQLDDLAWIGVFLDLKGRAPHGNACGLSLVAAGDDATVIV